MGWDKLFKIHLYGSFHCSREALKIMEAKNYSKIVSIPSSAATGGLEGVPHYRSPLICGEQGNLSYMSSTPRSEVVGARHAVPLRLTHKQAA